MTLDEPEPTPPARTLGLVWIVVGGVAVLVGLFATVVMVVVFGVAAVALGGGLLAVANLRAKSRARTARTLSGDPPPPASAPYRPPPAPLPPDDPGPGPDDDGPTDEGDEGDEDGDDDGGDEHSRAGTSREEDPPVPSRDVSISDVEDGSGNVISDQDRPGRRPGVTDDPQGA